jgi:hypothetical protein
MLHSIYQEQIPEYKLIKNTKVYYYDWNELDPATSKLLSAVGHIIQFIEVLWIRSTFHIVSPWHRADHVPKLWNQEKVEFQYRLIFLNADRHLFVRLFSRCNTGRYPPETWYTSRPHMPTSLATICRSKWSASYMSWYMWLRMASPRIV